MSFCPEQFFSGASILLLCDIISKIFTLPINAITASIGNPNRRMGGFTQQIHHRMIELQHFSIGYKENSLLHEVNATIKKVN